MQSDRLHAYSDSRQTDPYWENVFILTSCQKCQNPDWFLWSHTLHHSAHKGSFIFQEGRERVERGLKFIWSGAILMLEWRSECMKTTGCLLQNKSSVSIILVLKYVLGHPVGNNFSEWVDFKLFEITGSKLSSKLTTPALLPSNCTNRMGFWMAYYTTERFALWMQPSTCKTSV